MVACGLEASLDYLEGLAVTDDDLAALAPMGFDDASLDALRGLHFSGEVWAVPEGRVVFAEMAGEMSREDVAKTAEKGRWKDVKMQKKGIAKLSDSTVVISYECNAHRKDGQPYHALVSSGYTHRPDGWKLAFHQQTALQAR